MAQGGGHRPFCGQVGRVAAQVLQGAGVPPDRAAAGDQARIVRGPPRAGPTRRSPISRGWRPTPWASGAGGPARKASTAWPTQAAGTRGCSQQWWSPPPRRSPVSCPSGAGAAVTLEPCPAARQAAGPRAGQRGVDHDAVALAGRRPDQALAAPVVDLAPATRRLPLRLGGLGPVPAGLPGSGAGCRRVPPQRR
jgi:hypothetical protein